MRGKTCASTGFFSVGALRSGAMSDSLPQLVGHLCHGRALIAGFTLLCALHVAPALAVSPTPDSTVASACVKTVRWEAAQPPYNLRDENGEKRGYYADLLTLALQRLGCEARFVDMPWGRGIHELEAGRLDIVTGLLQNPERDRFAWFTRGVNFAPNRLYLSAEAHRRYPGLTSLADLRATDLKIGVETGAMYSREYNALLADPAFRERLYPAPDRPRAWRMLARHRLDGVVSDDATALLEGFPLLPSDSGVSGVLLLSAEPARIGVSRLRNDESFVRRLDDALGDLIADGTAARLRERYVPCETDPRTMGCMER